MKHPAILGLFLLAILTLSIPAAKAVDQAEPLNCNKGQATYYPRGDHWAKNPSGTPREYLIQKDGAPGLSINSVVSAIDTAFNYWGKLRCNNDGNNNEPLNISWMRGNSYYPNKNRGDDPNNNSFKNIIYFIDDVQSWQNATGADSLTIALATNLHFTTTGYVVSSDIEFNAGNFQFRVDNKGCSANQQSPLCYDLVTIATHEVGHWLGFNHVNCLDAVMYPMATTTKTMGESLPAHESVGACKVYNPVKKDTNYKAQWGEDCQAHSECVGGLCIKEQIGTVSYGYCTKNCSKNTDCPGAYVCTTFNGQNYCKPGHRGADGDVNPTPTDFDDDLCKPCNSGADCASSFCVQASDGSFSNCSKSCVPGDQSGQFGCPYGYECLEISSGSGACWPTTGSCDGQYIPSSEVRGLNEICWDYTNSQKYRCDSGLVCFGFLNAGECVPMCGDGISCPGANYTCCYGIDQYGNCITEGAAGAYGGCFDIRSENETCLRGAESICQSGLLCTQLESSIEANCSLTWDESFNTAKCYQMCSSKSDCRDGQECNLCLSVSSGIGLCWPPTPEAKPAKRPLGAVCSEDAQCESEFCVTDGSQRACSQLCSSYSTNSCPGKDENELGLQFKCVRSTIDGYCWPVGGPVKVADENEKVYGCDCRQGGSDPLGWIFFPLLALLALWPRKKARL